MKEEVVFVESEELMKPWETKEAIELAKTNKARREALRKLEATPIESIPEESGDYYIKKMLDFSAKIRGSL
ncbi:MULTISPECIES: hypothetical protein [Bacillus]|uniref:hypothetical protein n=1 Tax=Bacillus TaxID=1386 RepID=UPI0001A0B8AD|nr:MULTISPECIES: hypothetical protein [Bacillus]EEL32876.1 hypothetical protein bcere0019_39290 [Bacillus cereus Rock3-28]EOP22441.1 hypothetical protein IIS_03408 [Bacillus cereus VD131]KAF6561809.1 hypothetical protein G9F74_02700 [Bacillus sp. EKM202B]MBJ8038740.1 hypothetical protein [Bacillus cereus group sp. N17]MCU5302967.1 hypothetical protein [Bacillus toyonensis]